MKIRLIAALFLCSLLSSAQPIDLNNGLIGAYTFEALPGGFASLTDTSGTNANWGSLFPPVSRVGHAGDSTAITLSSGVGSGGSVQAMYSLLASPAYPSGNSPRSFSLWFRKDSLNLNVEADIQFLFFYGGYGMNTGCGIAVDYLGQKVYFAGYENDLIAFTSLQFNEWYHVVCTFDGNFGKLYVNGQLVSQASLLGWNTLSSNIVRYGFLSASIPTGGSQVNYSNSFSGLLDDVLVYNRVLNDNEVFKLFDPSWTPPGVGLDEEFLRAAVYPNPTTGTLYFDAQSDLRNLEFYTASGSLMWKTEHLQTAQLDVSDWPKGIYLLHAQRGNQPYHLRVVVQ